MALKNLFSVSSKRIENSKLKVDDKYTKKLQIPQYLPSKVKPNIFELCDKTKYLSLLAHINKANLPDDIKDFLNFKISRN